MLTFFADVAVSLNPKDYRVPQWYDRKSIEGNDVAGNVEALGDGVTDFKRGDKVSLIARNIDLS